MEHPNLKIRAAIFDVYGTMLEVGAPPKNADALWERLFQNMLDAAPPFSRLEFARRTSQIIARRHAEARARGIRWPEILWPDVVLEVIPALARLSPRRRDEFFLRQMEVGRTLRLAPGVANCLRRLNEEGVLLGIASNSQAYTLGELHRALQKAGVNLSIFDPHLRFWSFENGFSKPDPHVFRMLSVRLAARGISPAETLMVGDRLDNDIEPARVHGWRIWQLTNRKHNATAGMWRDLLHSLNSRNGNH